jgi:hypothetical protein
LIEIDLAGSHFGLKTATSSEIGSAMVDAEDRELFWFAETANEIWSSILGWYEACGAPLGLRS